MVLEVLDNEEELIKKILEKSSLSREELEKQIQKKKEEYGGLLTTAGAAYSIAKDLGVDLELKEEEVQLTAIKELDAGLGRASVKGVVMSISPTKNWEKGEKRGQVASITIMDSTGDARISFWNDNCALLDRVKPGDQVEVLNAITKDRNNSVELSYGRASQLAFKKSKDLPTYKEKLEKLGELKEGMDSVNCFARAAKVFPAKSFERNDGTKGKVANIIVTDGTETRLVLWDQQADWASRLDEGDTLKIEGAYVRDNNGKLELNLGWKGRLVKGPEDAPKLPKVESASERKKISELKDGDSYKEVRAVVVKAYPPTLFLACPKCGKKAEGKCERCGSDAKDTLIFNSELDDGTGVMRGVFFRDLAEQFLGVTASQVKEGGYDTNKILGIEKIFRGQVKRNQRFDRDELVVRRVKDVDLDSEIKALEC